MTWCKLSVSTWIRCQDRWPRRLGNVWARITLRVPSNVPILGQSPATRKP